MGLTLRRLEKENKPLKNLQNKILNKYDAKGLHIAFFVQNGLFSRYIGTVLDKSTPQRLTFEIENLFENIDNTVMFVNALDKVNQKNGRDSY